MLDTDLSQSDTSLDVRCHRQSPGSSTAASALGAEVERQVRWAAGGCPRHLAISSTSCLCLCFSDDAGSQKRSVSRRSGGWATLRLRYRCCSVVRREADCCLSAGSERTLLRRRQARQGEMNCPVQVINLSLLGRKARFSPGRQ